jgi:hypothetical protein
MRTHLVIGLCCGLLVFGLTAAGYAITITPTCDVSTLVSALVPAGSGITVTNMTLSSNSLPTGQLSCGTYTNASGTYGIGNGIVISSGNVADYNDGPNTVSDKTTAYGVAATPAQETLLQPISGGTPPFKHFDVTELTLTFSEAPDKNQVFFNTVFGSEEFPVFVGTEFNDAFGLYLNGTNIAFVGGKPINIDHPDFAAIPGTELNGVLAPGGNPDLLLSGNVVPGSTGNTMTFIVADTSDPFLDTTVFLSSFAAVPPTPPTSVPEPPSAALILASLLSVTVLASRVRRKLTRDGVTLSLSR